MAKKKIGADLPPEVVDGFNDWCDSNGLAKSRATEAAVKLLQLLPLAIRDLVMRGQWERLCQVFHVDESAEAEAALVESVRNAIRFDRQSHKGKRSKERAAG